MFVRYASLDLLYTQGKPEGLVYLKKSNVSNKLKYHDSNCMLQAEVISPLSKMIEDAYRDHGYTYTIETGGGYREYSTQERYWRRRENMYPGYGDDPFNKGGVICVPAVCSEHRTGYAIDFEATANGFKWLKENSYKYGFIHRYEGNKTEKTGVMDEVVLPELGRFTPVPGALCVPPTELTPRSTRPLVLRFVARPARRPV